MRRILSLLLVLVLVLSFVSCGKDDIIGVWEAKDTADLGMSITVEFTEDKMEMMGISMDYELDGDTIILNFMGEETEMEYKVKGDTLTLTVDGDAQEFVKVKD